MVRYKHIIKVIGNYVEKCFTIAQMKEKLSKLSHEEKLQLFKEKGLLNPGEEELYNELYKWYYYYMMGGLEEEIKLPEKERPYSQYNYKTWEERLQKFKDEIIEWEKEQEETGKDHSQMISITEELIQRYYDEREQREQELFQFERRIVDTDWKRTRQEPPITNDRHYEIDTQLGNDVKGRLGNELGVIEQRQINAQKEVKFLKKELNSLYEQYGAGAYILNSKIYKGPYWDNVLNSVPIEKRDKFIKGWEKIDTNIHNAMQKSPGLVQDTTLYHGGTFDVTKMIGDIIEFKGYTSTSFQEPVANYFSTSMSGSARHQAEEYTYKILAKKGAKGICGNDKTQGTLSEYFWQHEYLLDKGFKGKIADIDYENHIVTIVQE